MDIFKNAKWIRGYNDPFKPSDHSFLFYKKFSVSSPVKKAELHVCALGLGTYSINGKPVTQDVLCTPFTRYDKRVIFQSYIVTPLLQQGENVVSAHVGNGFYNNNMDTWNDRMASWRDDPKLIAVLSIEYTSGDWRKIETDTSWKWQNGPCVYNHMRQGEIYDARLRQIEFDDSAWQQAIIASPPGGVLEPMDMEPIRIVEKIKPIGIIGNVYDFGKNISGWVKIKGKGQPGQEVKLTYDEVLLQQGEKRDIAVFLEQHNCKVQHQCVYIMNGDGLEEYAPSFCYFGFRYVRVENEPEEFEIEAQKIHTDLQTVGNFVCSDEMLNKIHRASVNSTLTNYFGIPTDCPHREQNGWTGDALLSSDQSLMNFEMRRVYKKWLHDFKDVQRPSGQLPGIVPSPGWGYNWGSGPAWDSALIQIPWKVYLVTRSTELIEDMWKNMCVYMNYMDQMAQDDIVDYGLGDWCQPKEHPKCPSAVSDTSFYYINHILMAKMARLLKREDSIWEEKGETIRNAWRKAFLHKPALENYQTYWACALYQGLLNEDEKAWAVNKLVDLIKRNNDHIACGTLGVKFMLPVLSEYGYADLAYRIITNPQYPSYAYWINQGMSTLCEEWDMSNSRNHHMFSEVDNWFYRYIGGIRFEEEGLIIHPVSIKEITSFRVSHKKIIVEKDERLLKIQVPVKAIICWNNTIIEVEPGCHEFGL